MQPQKDVIRTMGWGLPWWLSWDGDSVKNTKKTFISNDAINWRYFSQILKIGSTESEDIETEKGAQPKQPDNNKQLLLFLTNAITMEPVRDLSDL